jgi:hypothetical protein
MVEAHRRHGRLIAASSRSLIRWIFEPTRLESEFRGCNQDVLARVVVIRGCACICLKKRVTQRSYVADLMAQPYLLLRREMPVLFAFLCLRVVVKGATIGPETLN